VLLVSDLVQCPVLRHVLRRAHTDGDSSLNKSEAAHRQPHCRSANTYHVTQSNKRIVVERRAFERLRLNGHQLMKGSCK
jgi:hypothetical protein